MDRFQRDCAVHQPMRYRFGFRWLFLAVLVFSVVFAGLARESRRLKQQARLVNELAQLEVTVRGREPTGLALATRKLLGEGDGWLSERIDEGWFSRPRTLVTWTATDEQIPMLVQTIKQLGAVQELHLEQSPVTDQGLRRLKKELPGLAIVTRTNLISRGIEPPTEHFATAAIQLLTYAGAVALCIIVLFVWPLVRWRKHRRVLPAICSRKANRLPAAGPAR